jgi:hypothetical protein
MRDVVHSDPHVSEETASKPLTASICVTPEAHAAEIPRGPAQDRAQQRACWWCGVVCLASLLRERQIDWVHDELR